ncbi:MAG TPA: LysE family translocator [Acetobacteraceae bacterium]|nr:LysE family translocator [Acetobacteraceae bacterium]
MSAELLLAFAGFAFATSITPGPNNAMLLASGVNHGFRRTLPHMAGVCLGCVLMLVLVALGLGALFTATPVLYVALRYISGAYLLWLAWRIARSGPVAAGHGRGRPMSFLEAAAFQWVNPKAWIMVVGAVTTYAPRDGFPRAVAVIAVLFLAINAPSISLWAGCGVALRRVLTHPRRVRAFNGAMALLLVLSLYPLLEH